MNYSVCVIFASYSITSHFGYGKKWHKTGLRWRGYGRMFLKGLIEEI